MITGLMAGVFWAADTVILGIALAMTPFVSTEEAVFLAPCVSTFLHDLCSAFWMLLYTGIRRQFRGVKRALQTRSGKFIILGALLGGPVGMSGYVAAIYYMGAGYTSIVSSVFPALGALLSSIFLKEKMKGYQIAGLVVSLLGVIALGYTPGEAGRNYLLGFLCAAVCVFGWALEAVICEHALMIRQATSAVFYGIVLLPALKGWGVAVSAATSSALPVILAAAFFGTASYLCYYLAIHRLGASKAMQTLRRSRGKRAARPLAGGKSPHDRRGARSAAMLRQRSARRRMPSSAPAYRVRDGPGLWLPQGPAGRRLRRCCRSAPHW